MEALRVYSQVDMLVLRYKPVNFEAITSRVQEFRESKETDLLSENAERGVPVRVEALDHIRDLFGIVLRYQHVLLDCEKVRTRPFRIVAITREYCKNTFRW